MERKSLPVKLVSTTECDEGGDRDVERKTTIDMNTKTNTRKCGGKGSESEETGRDVCVVVFVRACIWHLVLYVCH